jgi:hypothetical protein
MVKFSTDCVALEATDESVMKIMEYVRSRTAYTSSAEAVESVASSATMFMGDSSTWNGI